MQLARWQQYSHVIIAAISNQDTEKQQTILSLSWTHDQTADHWAPCKKWNSFFPTLL